jgi:hypothetical protein
LEDEEPVVGKHVPAPSQETSFDLLLEDDVDQDVPLIKFKKPKASSQLTPNESRAVGNVPSPGLSPIPERSSMNYDDEDLDALELEDELPEIPPKKVITLKSIC